MSDMIELAGGPFAGRVIQRPVTGKILIPNTRWPVEMDSDTGAVVGEIPDWRHEVYTAVEGASVYEWEPREWA